jgi:hypothetical protein
MMVLKVKEKEYKVKFGYNSFCDTDLMDRAQDLLELFRGEEVEDDADVNSLGKIKELFCCVRDLLYVGFEKYNPVETVQDIGNILDDYNEDATEEDKRGLLDLFIMLTEELMSEGFLAGLMKEMNAEDIQNNGEKITKIPQDHKKPAKKTTKK